MRHAMLVSVTLLAGCQALSGLDSYCPLEPGASPEVHACRAAPPQCGCPSGEACRLADDGLRYCEVPGLVGPGERCAGAGECVLGTDCLTFTDFGHCRAFCTTDADCLAMGPSSRCIVITEGLGTGLCTVHCAPGRDDEHCGPGLACQILGGDRSDCRFEGTAALYDPCGGDLERPCARALTCVTSSAGGNFCLPMCGPGLPPCERPSTCAVPVEPGISRRAEAGEWGVCVEFV